MVRRNPTPRIDTPAASRRGRAGRLTRDAIVDAAAEIVHEGGYDALNMRALAERCGVGTPTIYRHIDTKEGLLGALADRMFAEVTNLTAPRNTSWEAEILDLFASARQVLTDHPELIDIVARQHSHGQVGFATAERAIRALRQAGVDGAQAALAFNALATYTIGFAQRERHMSGVAMGHRWALVHELPADTFANVHAQAHILIPRPTDEHFTQGLRVIVRGFVDGDAP